MIRKVIIGLADIAAMCLVALAYWLTQSIPLAAVLTGLVSGASWWAIERWGGETDDRR